MQLTHDGTLSYERPASIFCQAKNKIACHCHLCAPYPERSKLVERGFNQQHPVIWTRKNETIDGVTNLFASQWEFWRKKESLRCLIVVLFRVVVVQQFQEGYIKSFTYYHHLFYFDSPSYIYLHLYIPCLSSSNSHPVFHCHVLYLPLHGRSSCCRHWNGYHILSRKYPRRCQKVTT